MSESDNGGNSRLDRIEAMLEIIVTIQRDMQQEHQMLLRAQVVQGDELRQLAKRTDERFQSLVAAQKRTDDAMTALIGTVGAVVRN